MSPPSPDSRHIVAAAPRRLGQTTSVSPDTCCQLADTSVPTPSRALSLTTHTHTHQLPLHQLPALGVFGGVWRKDLGEDRQFFLTPPNTCFQPASTPSPSPPRPFPSSRSEPRPQSLCLLCCLEPHSVVQHPAVPTFSIVSSAGGGTSPGVLPHCLPHHLRSCLSLLDRVPLINGQFSGRLYFLFV